MILAASLTPAWQRVMVFDSFQLGQVNRAVEIHWFASGKVINVARALKNLGAECRTLSFVGGATGDCITEEFSDDEILARWVQTTNATRVCTTLLQREGGQTTELVENAAALRDNEIEAFRQAFFEEAATAETIVLTGSLPQGVVADYYAQLLEATKARLILDIRGPELLATLKKKPFCVKPNRDEFEHTVRHDCSDDPQLVKAMRQLCERGAGWVLVTDGSRATWLVSSHEAFKLTPPSVTVVNPIGAGDCFTATLAWAVHRGESMLDAVRLATAAASEDVTRLLPARFDTAQLAAHAEAVHVERHEPL